MRSVIYQKHQQGTYHLEESRDLLVIRTKRPGDPLAYLGRHRTTRPLLHHLEHFDAFPESSVYLFKCVGDPDTQALRQYIKDEINKVGDPTIAYAGTVFCYADSGIYQIYTGNLFVKFADTCRTDHTLRLLRRHDLDLKQRLGFAHNAYFVEPVSNLGRNIFDKALDLHRLAEVESCHPELVVRRKTVWDRVEADPIMASHAQPDWVKMKIRLYEAWQQTQGEGVRICVIDDGLDFEHPAFRRPGKIVAYRDMLDKGNQRRPEHLFREKHGTACAGIACSEDTRALGVAPQANLIPIRSLGLGSVLEAEAFYWAVAQGTDIISCSWGPPDGDFTNDHRRGTVFPIPDHTNLAIQYAATQGRGGRGCLIFFAAGNGNECVVNDGYASHPNVLAIGASNQQDEKAVYGDYGNPLFCCFPSGDFQEIAPDEWRQQNGVLVADRLGEAGYDPGDIYPLFSGTSASCPGMAGVAALALSLQPNLMAKDLITILQQSCKPLGAPEARAPNGYHPLFGYGLIQADQVVQNTLNHESKMNPIPPNIVVNPLSRTAEGMNNKQKDNSVLLLSFKGSFVEYKNEFKKVKIELSVSFMPVRFTWIPDPTRKETWSLASTGFRAKIKAKNGKIDEYTTGKPIKVNYKISRGNTRSVGGTISPSGKDEGSISAGIGSNQTLESSFEDAEKNLAVVSKDDFVRWEYRLARKDAIVRDYLYGNYDLKCSCIFGQEEKSKRTVRVGGTILVNPLDVKIFDQNGGPFPLWKELYARFYIKNQIMRSRQNILGINGVEVSFKEDV